MADLQYILPQFNIFGDIKDFSEKLDLLRNVGRDNPKQLGTTEISLYYDTNNNCFCLEKR